MQLSAVSQPRTRKSRPAPSYESRSAVPQLSARSQGAGLEFCQALKEGTRLPFLRLPKIPGDGDARERTPTGFLKSPSHWDDTIFEKLLGVPNISFFVQLRL